jgi:hypothetical protein
MIKGLILLLGAFVWPLQAVAQFVTVGERECPRVIADGASGEYKLNTDARCFRSKKAAERAGFVAAQTETESDASDLDGEWSLLLTPRSTSCSELAGPRSIPLMISSNENNLQATLPDGKVLSGFILKNEVIFALEESFSCAAESDGEAKSLTSITLSRRSGNRFDRAVFRYAQNCGRRCSDNFAGVAERP